jgi:putative acetyltransferase
VSDIAIERAGAPTAEVRALIGELDAFLAAAYTPEQQHGVALDALFTPHLRFFVARVDGVATGCGGVALFAEYAEVKRMYVRPAARGTGVARALLARVETEARSAGITDLRLETGVHQPAAIRLYERAGFRPCDAFGPYATMPPAAIATSLFYVKRLSAESV